MATLLKQLAAPVKWLANYEDALEKAELALENASELPGYQQGGAGLVMALFTGSDWCPYCKYLDEEVFQDEAFRMWFNSRRMVPLVVDFPQTEQSENLKKQNAKLVEEYDVQGFPTVLAINVTSVCKADGTCGVVGREVGRVKGYQKGSGATSWIESFSAAARIK